MSKARLVITAVVVEGRTQGEVARAYGVSQGWISRLVARYRAEGEAAFWPRSRRPKTSPGAVDPTTVELIIRLRKELTGDGLDAGPDTICWHLQHHHGVTLSAATVARYLTRAGLVTPTPKKRPKSSYIRFAADLPNECWQSDFTHYPLAAGVDTEVLSWIDDCSRYALSVTAHRRVTGPIVLTSFRETAAQHGTPASTLTDNGMVYTTRYSGGKGGRNAFEAQLRRLGVVQKNSRPNHPTTCGKVERFQQTLKKWAGRPTRSARHDRPAAGPARRLRRRLQQPAPTPRPAAPRHPGQRLSLAAQSAPGQQPGRRHARPDPPRPRRRHRRGHPPPCRPAAPHRHRANPRPHPCPAAGPGPQHQDPRRRHRRTAPRAHPRPQPRLPAHRPTTRPAKENLTTIDPEPRSWVQGHSDVSRDHIGAPGRIRTCDTRFRRAVLYPLSYEGGARNLMIDSLVTHRLPPSHLWLCG